MQNFSLRKQKLKAQEYKNSGVPHPKIAFMKMILEW